MKGLWGQLCLALAAGSSLSSAASITRGKGRDNSSGDNGDKAKLAECPGYKATHVHKSATKVTADLKLAGKACNVFGDDLDNLKLEVNYETAQRLHIKIYDVKEQVYQIPESVFPRPDRKPFDGESDLKFDYKAQPFSFTISRRSTGEVLFDTSAASLVIESQYLRLRTKLPDNPNLYGLGESTDSFRLETDDYRRTLWNYDDGVPNHRNLYGSHPVYIEHRKTGSHGVFLLNSNGMDIDISKDGKQQFLEYNVVGGVFDFYFMAGPSPIDVSKQYAEIAGLPVMVPYAGLGFHNCRWGYRDVYELAEVVANYSAAGIPLQTMWADIDYMEGRSIFSVDPDRFPMHMMRELVDHLHKNKQDFTVMVDPAVASRDYGPFHRGIDQGAFLRFNGSVYEGVVWPGATVYPDWFNPHAQGYWTGEFKKFFSADDGVDIDFLWIDMNEPSNFQGFSSEDSHKWAEEHGLPPQPPPTRSPPRPIEGFPCDFQPEGTECKRDEDSTNPKRAVQAQPEHQPEVSVRADSGKHKGLPGRDLLYPKYKIENGGGDLSAKTVRTDLLQDNGLAMYDTHSLYGFMMSVASRNAMLARRPGKRPLVITRSTFAGAGNHVSHWLGDNGSNWPDYRFSISGMLEFNAIYQISVVGSDVCGFGNSATEELCARWAMLGAFQTFYRNHNAQGSDPQEFYRWESVTKAAKKAIDIRYRLLDYMYTALQEQSVSGTPALNPMFFLYPHDPNTYGLELQFFYGPGLLVAPVTDEGATSVDVYLPEGVFYDFYTHKKVVGQGKSVTVSDQSLTDIPLFLRGGVIIPMRTKSGMTTSDVREQDFELIVPLDKDDEAHGSLYLDDGESLEPKSTSTIKFDYKNGSLRVSGQFGFGTQLKIVKVTVLGKGSKSKASASSASSTSESTKINVDKPLTGPFTIEI